MVHLFEHSFSQWPPTPLIEPFGNYIFDRKDGVLNVWLKWVEFLMKLQEFLDTELCGFTWFGITILCPQLKLMPSWCAHLLTPVGKGVPSILLTQVADSGGFSPQKLLGQSGDHGLFQQFFFIIFSRFFFGNLGKWWNPFKTCKHIFSTGWQNSTTN